MVKQTDRPFRIADYYDAERDEIIDFPPMTPELIRRLKPIKRRLNRSCRELEELLDAQND